MEDRDEIAQDLSCMLAHSQGTFSRVADFGIDIAAPTIGLSRVSTKTTKNYSKLHIICLFVAVHTPKKKKKKYDDSYSYHSYHSNSICLV